MPTQNAANFGKPYYHILGDTLPDADIAQTGVTQHQAALSIGQSQISFTGNLQDLESTGASTGGNQVMVSTAAGVVAWESGTTLRTSLGVDASGTDNSTNVTLAGTPNYITIAGQVITRNQIDLAADVTGVLPSANLDSDTAHLSTTQTFTGTKTFNDLQLGGNLSGGGQDILNVGSLGIGTTTVPHGAIGWAKLAIDGTDSSSAGPHIQLTTATDNYPLLQVLGYSHDSVHLLFDSYYDGSMRSADIGSNFEIYKGNDLLHFRYDSGVTAGNVVTWNDGIIMDTAGRVGINTPSVPKNSVGAAKLGINGTDSSASGPHIQLTTDSDNYPLYQILAYSHDNIQIGFDSYNDGSNSYSSDLGSNFRFLKTSDNFRLQEDGNVTPGALITWNTIFETNASNFNIFKTLNVNTINERTAAAGVTIDGLLIKDGGIPVGAVTAHEASLSIAQSQLSLTGSLQDLETLGANTIADQFLVSTAAGTLAWESGATARTSLGVDVAGTDNSTNVTLTGTPNYITIAGQVITRNQIDLAADVTGVLPSANLDSDTAHLSGSQTFTGTKIFNSPQLGGTLVASSNDITGVGDLGIGTTTAPHGGVGIGVIAVDGLNANINGPHVQFTTATDDYPLLCFVNYTHDNVQILFDSYYDGTNMRSSHSGSNFRMVKLADKLQFHYESGITAGSVATFATGFEMQLDGDVDFYQEVFTDTIREHTAAAGVTIDGVLLKDSKMAPTYLSGVGYETTWIPALSMTPRATNGAASGTDELATNDINREYYLFDGATEEGVQFAWSMPDNWDRGTIKAKFQWDGSTGATASDGVTWGIAAEARTNDDAMDNAFSASVDTDDALTAVGDLHTTAASAAVTVSATPAIGDMIMFEITRVVGDTNDTMTEDAKLFGVWIQWQTTNPVTTAW